MPPSPGHAKSDSITAAINAAQLEVEFMDEGPRKTVAFQTVLTHLLQRGQGGSRFDSAIAERTGVPVKKRAVEPRASGTTGRLLALIEEGTFRELRSLAEIRQVLAEKGWQYSPEDLGTPLTRLVRRKHLRRTLAAHGGKKKIWKYSNY